MALVYLNGEFIAAEQARVSVFDRGFMFADSLYEVIPVYAGKPFCLDQHIERLSNGLGAIGMQTACAGVDWAGIINKLIEKNGFGNQSLYLQVTRGVADRRDHSIPHNLQPTVFVMSNPLRQTLVDAMDLSAISAISVNDIRWSRCDIKSTALLANIMLRERALEAGADEAILIRDGLAMEGAASNLFVVHDQRIYTAPKGHYILPGITRDLIVTELHKGDHNINLGLSEQAPTIQQLFEAQEIWLTSSTREIMPVTVLNGESVGQGGIGSVCRAVTELYLNVKHRLIAGT